MVAVPSIGRADQPTPQRRAPEADATRRLYEQYARQIHAYCLHQLGNREEAEDATQSTFLNAFRGLQRGVDPEFESAWLYKIAQNVCLTRQRSSSRRRRVESPGDLDAMQDVLPAHQVDSDELINLPEALNHMPEQQRRALLLREWQGLSYKEIGEELDLSQAAVETLLFRARRSLAAGLAEEPKRGIAKRLQGGGDAGSLLALVKSILLTGGAKVAATVATVAATSVVAATPAARHVVEDAVTFAPSHAQKPAPRVVHPKAPAVPTSSTVGAVPHTSVPAAAIPATAAHHAVAPATHVQRDAVPARHVTTLHVAAPPATPAAPASVTPVDEPASTPAPATPAPAPAEPAAEPGTRAAPASGGDQGTSTGSTQGQGSSGGDSSSAKDNGTTKKDTPAPTGNGNGNGNGKEKKNDTVVPAPTPLSQTTPPAPTVTTTTPPTTTTGTTDTSNGNGNGKANGKDKQTDTPVSAPAPAPTTTTTTTSTVAPAPPVTPTPAPADSSTGNGKGNGNGKKK